MMENIPGPNYNKVIEHLFRHDAGRLTAILTKIFGIENIELAEDVVQDTLYKALQVWPYKGIPDNPSGWLFRAAKNRAVDVLRRENLSRKFSGEVSAKLKSEWSLSAGVNEYFSENEIKDGQLRMIFTCCHPELPAESQTALALKNMCGFSIKEIAKAFLVTEEVITKRLLRAKDKIREGKIKFVIPSGNELEQRLNNVLSVIYLLFNEGYNSSKENLLIRDDLIEEAIRLAELLAEHPLTTKPVVHALLALMFLHYARTPARQDEEGNIILLERQDRSLWNKDFIEKGIAHLEKSPDGYRMTEYHIEAGIAFFHSTAGTFEETEWKKILWLYDMLYSFKNTPVVALNRSIVYSKIHGPEAGIEELKRIKDKSLDNYHLYHSALADMYIKAGNHAEASSHLKKAIMLTASEAEKNLLNKRLKELNP